jgi:molybdopterin synthase sulfur carrier subunit
MKTVVLPQQFKKLTDGNGTIEIQANTIIEAIHELESRFNGFLARLVKSDGSLNQFLNIYVNGEDIRFLSGKETVLTDGVEICIIPAIAGG